MPESHVDGVVGYGEHRSVLGPLGETFDSADGPMAEGFGVFDPWCVVESTESFDQLGLGVSGPRSPVSVAQAGVDLDA